MKSNKMKPFFLFFLLVIPICTFGQLNEEYLKYHKTGLYKYEGDTSGVLIKRTKRKQIEYLKDKKLILKVAWKNNDEYWLTFIKEKDFPGSLKKGYIIKTKIIYADKNKYTGECICNECGQGKVTFTFVKVK